LISQKDLRLKVLTLNKEQWPLSAEKGHWSDILTAIGENRPAMAGQVEKQLLNSWELEAGKRKARPNEEGDGPFAPSLNPKRSRPFSLPQLLACLERALDHGCLIVALYCIA
jgi:hypothetical protein